MEENHTSLEYLPTSLSIELMKFEPISVLPPPKLRYKEISLDRQRKSIPRNHQLELSFRPYFRASKHANAIKKLYHKYKISDFDVSIEEQNRFLHESPRNHEFKASKMPELEMSGKRLRGEIKHRALFKTREKINKSRFPPIFDDFIHKFNMQLSDLSISSTRSPRMKQ